MKIMSMKRHVVVADTLEDIVALAATVGLKAEHVEDPFDHVVIIDVDSFDKVILYLGGGALIVEPNAGETIWYVDTIENVERDFVLCPMPS